MELENSAEDETLAIERDASVRRALQSLSPAQAAVLKLSFFPKAARADRARTQHPAWNRESPARVWPWPASARSWQEQ